MMNFETLGLPAALNAALTRMNYTVPTPIQAQAIPAALEGHDILGSAQTGTGKTAAFCIPLMAHLMKHANATALVMTPTRELAAQVMAVANQMAGPNGIRTALLIGGAAMQPQFKQLAARPRLIIGTPGRINDHLRRNKYLLDAADFLVLDEADRMLDMGFSIQIDEILKFLPVKRQTLMFSATLPHKIIDFSKRYMRTPVRVAVQSEKPTADNIVHVVVPTTEAKKYDDLVGEIEARSGSIIIFVKTKRGADKLVKKLREESIPADAIHGDLRQNKRDQVIKAFRDQKHRILVATDVASRGLDVPHVQHVINYDLPQVPEDYVHRIGRTARAGAKGQAMCFVTSADSGKWAAINRILNPGSAPARSANDSDRGYKPSKNKRRTFGKPAANGGAPRRDGAPKRERDAGESPYKSARPFGQHRGNTSASYSKRGPAPTRRGNAA